LKVAELSIFFYFGTQCKLCNRVCSPHHLRSSG